ncbi:MAG: hypothetical protein E4H17_02240 [Gemmatimonadales bacterium]|nr:MAG: hypothetical protein E4H17_02240 [Gemmatimonadales bacterium]
MLDGRSIIRSVGSPPGHCARLTGAWARYCFGGPCFRPFVGGQMSKVLAVGAVFVMLLGASVALAFPFQGYVHCEGNGAPMAGIPIVVTSTDGAGFTGQATTDETGYYFVHLPGEYACYRATVVTAAGDHVTSPVAGYLDFCVAADANDWRQDWVIYSPSCVTEQMACWLTGGGAKFNQITDSFLGQSGNAKTSKLYNWGGNVNPGCSATAGDGGQWNTIDAAGKLHFQGFSVQVVRCGNVEGIPPGSTSPVTPYNFIEFKGIGRVQGIKGNKTSYPLVYFFARAEDRNEPGSNGQRDGAGKDRYFLNVFTDRTDPAGSSVMLVDIDGNPATVDPLIITDGNMQIHIPSCIDLPIAAPTMANSLAGMEREPAAGGLPTTVEFAAPRPNPTSNLAVLRFALPREATVSLGVFDVSGRLVNELATGVTNAGQHSVTWNLLDRNGQRVPNGVFFARLAVDGQIYTRAVCVAR